MPRQKQYDTNAIISALLKHYGASNSADVDTISSLCTVKKIKKGKVVFDNEGSFNVAVLIEGCIRGYIMTKDGVDVTDCFLYRFGEAAMHSLGKRGIPICQFDAIIDSTLLFVPASLFNTDDESGKALSDIYEKLFPGGLLLQNEHKHVLMCYEAYEKYNWFTSKYPGLIDMIPHSYVASFLGITPVTLSRARHMTKE